MNRYKVFLDSKLKPSDVIERLEDKTFLHYYLEEDWEIARNYEEFINTILQKHTEEKTLMFVSLGHDVGEKNGYECVNWLSAYIAEFKMEFPTFAIHTKNGQGAKNMQKLLTTFLDGYYC